MVIWNFGGWENLSVVSGELEDPKRNYIRAVGVALPMVVNTTTQPVSIVPPSLSLAVFSELDYFNACTSAENAVHVPSHTFPKTAVHDANPAGHQNPSG